MFSLAFLGRHTWLRILPQPFEFLVPRSVPPVLCWEFFFNAVSHVVPCQSAVHRWNPRDSFQLCTLKTHPPHLTAVSSEPTTQSTGHDPTTRVTPFGFRRHSGKLAAPRAAKKTPATQHERYASTCGLSETTRSGSQELSTVFNEQCDTAHTVPNLN